MKNDGFTFRKRAEALNSLSNGIKLLLITKEHNAWIHCLAAVCVLIAGMVFGLSGMEWIAVTIVIGAVLAAEGGQFIHRGPSRFTVSLSIMRLSSERRLGGGAVLLMAIAAAIVRVRHFYT